MMLLYPACDVLMMCSLSVSLSQMVCRGHNYSISRRLKCSSNPDNLELGISR